MLYLIKTTKYTRTVYSLYDSNTDSILEGNINYVLRLVNDYKMQIVNAKIVDNEVVIKKWPHDIYKIELNTHTGSKYVVLSQINDTFTIANDDEVLTGVASGTVKSHIMSGFVANCEHTRDENGFGFYRMVDVNQINNSYEFEMEIAEKYNQFIAKSKMMGLDMSFKYSIEGKEVKILRYGGSSNRIIIPSFITSITADVFRECTAKEVKLNNGLKYIGNGAFRDNDIQSIEIPESVEFIGQNAFKGNKKLFEKDRSHYSSNFKLLNNKTMVLE